MKKLLCMMLALCMVLALAACGGKEETANTEATKTAETNTNETEAETTPVTTEGKTETPEEPEDTETALGDTDTKPTPEIDENKATYIVKVVDEAGNPVTTATLVQICDETCSPVKLTDGVGEKTLEINENYHVELTSGLPAGYEYATEETEFTFDENNVCTIVLKAVA